MKDIVYVRGRFYVRDEKHSWYKNCIAAQFPHSYRIDSVYWRKFPYVKYFPMYIQDHKVVFNNTCRPCYYKLFK